MRTPDAIAIGSKAPVEFTGAQVLDADGKPASFWQRDNEKLRFRCLQISPQAAN